MRLLRRGSPVGLVAALIAALLALALPAAAPAGPVVVRAPLAAGYSDYLQQRAADPAAALGLTAQKRLLPMQPGDVPATYADVDDLVRDVGFQPATPIEEGVRRFVDWYRSYYHC